MTETSIEKSALTEAVLALFEECHVGPSGKGTWFTDGDPDSGILGTVEGLDAARASTPLTAGDPLSLASHVNHVRFALELANRAAKGENPYSNADWAGSWEVRKVDESEWRALISSLKAEYLALRAFVAAGKAWDDKDFMTGILGLVAHGAWHLGAIRQGLGLISAPGR